MNIAIYQILVPIVCIFFIAKASSNFFRGKKTIRELMGWIAFWGGIMIIAIVPEITEQLALVLGIKSNVNALVFSLLGILSYISFKLLVISENQEQELTRLTRALALKDFDKESKKNL